LSEIREDAQPLEMKQTIYIALLEEGVDCWRAVEAVHQQGDVYTVISENPDPEDEHWEFSRGDEVRCRAHTFSGGSTGLVAFAKAAQSQ
jgi:hypothetical protein